MDDNSVIQMKESHLRKLFEEIKTRDFTQGQFEKEKTARIVAYCDLLKSSEPQTRGDLLRALNKIFESEYQGYNWSAP